MSKCHAGIEIPWSGPCPKCGADDSDVCWPGINNDLAELERLRKALKDIAEFCSGDLTTLGAIARLASIQNEARALLAVGTAGQPAELKTHTPRHDATGGE